MSITSALPPITPRTFAVVQDLMNREGLDSSDSLQVSLYVERLIARERLFRTLDDVRERTAGIPPEDLNQIIEEAVESVARTGPGATPA